MNENKMNINWLTCIYDVLACNMPTHLYFNKIDNE